MPICQSRTFIFLILPVLIAGGGVPARGQEAPGAGEAPAAVSDPSMRRQFEGLYAAWREAMEKSDFEAWKQVTASSRQGLVRNQIVSQRLSYPKALFLSPVRAPDVKALVHVDTLVRGDTASGVYFGKADFGLDTAAQVRDNFIVLRFIREFGVWKFDNLRVVKFGDDPDVLLKLRNRDLSFLKAPEFEPDAAPPPVPSPVNAPDYIGEVWVTAVGYEAKIVVNGRHQVAIANDSGRELINGGLARGVNRIRLKVKEVPLDAGTPRHLEIAIYGAKGREGKAGRFYHYRVTAESKPENFQATFRVPGS